MGTFLGGAGTVFCQHGVEGRWIGAGKGHAHGPFDQSRHLDEELVLRVAVRSPKAHHQLLGMLFGQGLTYAAGSVTGKTEKQPFRAEIGNLARPLLVSTQLKLRSEFYRSARTGTSFHRYP
ncbi:hypothetical protein RE428_44930 [Marinobacter nanhaiticus D15-8W]|nr:hypothetical protein RE428_44930 [Marinobacter nanhaiticus D15-8W]